MNAGRNHNTFGEIDEQHIESVEIQKNKKKKNYKGLLVAICFICCTITFSFVAKAIGLGNLKRFYINIGSEDNCEISLPGYADSPEMLALKEWQDFCSSYDQDKAILRENDKNSKFLESPYSIYSEEMSNKIEEIATKYNLKLHTDCIIIERENFEDYIGDFFEENSCFVGSVYLYENGTFGGDGFYIKNKNEKVEFQISRIVRGTLETACLNIDSLEDYTEWEYKTKNGQSVLGVLGKHKSLILCDMEDSFFWVNVLAGYEEGIDIEILENIADSFNYSILGNVIIPNMISQKSDKIDSSIEDNMIYKIDGYSYKKANVRFVEPNKYLDEVASLDESQRIIENIKGLSAHDFQNAVFYNGIPGREDSDTLVFQLSEDTLEDFKVYGYKNNNSNRGIVIKWGEIEEYYDLCWGSTELYSIDVNNDGNREMCIVMVLPGGTGVSVERLFVIARDNQQQKLKMYKFSPEDIKEHIESNLDFLLCVDTNELFVGKSIENKGCIFEPQVDNISLDTIIDIDCLNQIRYEIREDRLFMKIEISFGVGMIGPTLFSLNENNYILFEVLLDDERIYLI